MDPNVAYNVVHANNRRDTQVPISQENTAYNIHQRSLTQSDEDNEYSTVENTGYIEHNTAGDIKSTESSVLDNKSNTKRIRQKVAKNESGKKWFAILVVVAFVVSLLVAVAALVYTNIELKNQMSSNNKQIQSMNEQLNNRSSQQIQILQAQLSDSILLLQNNFSEQLSSTNKQVQSTNEQLNNHIAELGPMAYYPGARIGNPASSCSDIPQDRPSGEYWIRNTTSSPVQVYCDMNRTSCSCNTAGGRGWMRVANLDMTDPNQNCPEGLRLVTRTEPPSRTCGRVEEPAGCTSTTYSTYGVEYSKVCGRIIAYQSTTPDAFTPYFNNRALSIDDVYVDGVSLTHGQSPRQHIWTFVNAIDETRSTIEVCPCTRPDLTYTGVVPPFIGQDYFCETGSRQLITSNTHIVYSDDPLWDGQGCGGNSTCCEFNNPPWFCKQLPQPTTDDIEMRICADQALLDEDTPIEIIEMYVR
ncbi:uncharacterized protein LOC135336519 [Halichondria panicea]|uniref:uncharacterized protein LOC135336519 n=1 Tax=Halichondria panicea TaxID=6063 RepID=UPI00312B45F9